VNGAQVGVFKKTNEVSLRCFLEGTDGSRLETKISLEILCDLTDETLEWELADQELSRFLVPPDLTKSDGTGPVPMGFLDSSGGWGRFTGGLGGQLLTRGFTSGRLTRCLLSTGHLLTGERTLFRTTFSQDQRCMGVEFVADLNSSLGDCNLIDVITAEISSEVEGFTYDSNMVYNNLDVSITGGEALCFAKDDDCYPYFEAADLNDVMLKCYCPNNRKGYYTKKVTRTVETTRYCGGDDLEVNTRIKKAQANRMFHLCENWCLFLTENPEAESWYWDPWQGCWREQYAGVGSHMSYCNRVIRSPDAIEMKFLNHRKNLFCQSPQPTQSPSNMDSFWYLAEEEDSCDDACRGKGKVCDENLTASVTENNVNAGSYFAEAGVTCVLEEVGNVDWALPGYEVSSGICLTRHSTTENTGCNWAIGLGYQRLCACA